MKKTIISFGEILWDILPDRTVLGGAPFNFAYRINALGNRATFISSLGRDEFGQKAFDRVIMLGLETAFLQWDTRYPTGTVQVSFDSDNNPDYVILPDVAYDYIDFKDSFRNVASSADCVCFGTLIQRNDTSRKTLEHLLDFSGNSLKFYDINLRKKCFTKETIRFSLENADVLKLNEDEAYLLSDILGISCNYIPDFCEKMVSTWSLNYCLVTLAEKGVLGVSEKGEMLYIPGYGVRLVDSLGSGDAFSAGFVHKILSGASMEEACKLGNTLGAVVASQPGATCAVSPEEIKRLAGPDVKRNTIPEFEKYIAE